MDLFAFVVLSSFFLFLLPNPSVGGPIPLLNREGRRLAQSDTDSVQVATADALTDAIDDLDTGQTIVLQDEVYPLTSTLTINISDVQLQGNGEGTIVRCPPRQSALIIRAVNVSVSGLIFENCQDAPAVIVEVTEDEGSSNTTAAFDRVLFRNNTQQPIRSSGSGIRVQCTLASCIEGFPRVQVINCTFQENQSDQGSGIYCRNCALDITDSIFRNNSAGSEGAAISVEGETTFLEINRTQFSDNRVVNPGRGNPLSQANGLPLEAVTYFILQFPTSTGGAVSMNSIHRAAMTECTFTNNQAPAGGAISAVVHWLTFNEIPEIPFRFTLTNCTFESNTAAATEPTPNDDLEFNHGGALYILSTTEISELWTLNDCLFLTNSARYGGAIHAATIPLENRFELNGVIFEDNSASEAGGAIMLRSTNRFTANASRWEGNSAVHGGALFLTNNAFFTTRGLTLIDDGRLGVRNAFRNNSATHGGAIMCAGCGDVVLIDVNFTGNIAERFGGGVYALDSPSSFMTLQCNFEENTALRGGAVAFRAMAGVTLSMVEDPLENVFIGNKAVAGAAIFAEGTRQQDNRLQITSCRFTKNSALNINETGLALEEPSSVGASGTSTVLSLRSTPRTSIQPVIERAYRVDLKERTVRFQSLLTSLPIDCGNGGGGGVCLVFNEVPEDSLCVVIIENNIFESNDALVGGALFVNVDGAGWNTIAIPICPARTPSTDPCRLFHLSNNTLQENVATFGAGGLFVSQPENILVGCRDDNIEDWVSLLTAYNNNTLSEENCIQFIDNTVEENGGRYGPDVASGVYALFLRVPQMPITNHTGGERLLPPCLNQDNCSRQHEATIMIDVRDAFNQTISGGITDASLQVVLLADFIVGEQVYLADKGVVNVDSTIGLGVDSETDIIFQHAEDQDLATNLTFFTRPCYPGEREVENVCEPCLRDQYSLDPLNRCRDCESRAECAGRSALVPISGYWHSTPFSPQFHECIISKACSYGNRSEQLSMYYINGTRTAARIAQLDAHVVKGGTGIKPTYFDYNQCAKGYKGILCGSCSPGYGHFPGGECVECPANQTTSAFIIIALALWTFTVLLVNIFLTLSSTRKQIWIAMAEGAGQHRSFQGAMPLPMPQREAQMAEFRSSRILARGNTGQHRSLSGSFTFQRRVVQPRRPLVTDHIVALEKLTEIVKILVNYLQVTSVAISINVTWSSVIEVMLSVEALLISVSNGSYFVPLDCSFNNYDQGDPTPHSVKALWLRICFPFILLFFFLSGFLIFSQVLSSANAFRSKAPSSSNTHPGHYVSARTYSVVIILVVIYFSYINVTSEFMRAVNCIKVDEDSDNPHEYDIYAVEKGFEVWAEDTDLHCYEDKHQMPGILGWIGLFVYSFMIVVFIIVWFPWNKDHLNDPDFIARFGFIYQGYDPTRRMTVPWEAAIAIRKALIAAAVVFAFPLGPNLQVVSALGVVILAEAVHLLVQPFKIYEGHPNVPEYAGEYLNRIRMPFLQDYWMRFNNDISLNHLESASLTMSMTVFYAGVLFNDPNTSDIGRHVMTSFTLFVNLLFIWYIMYRLYAGAHLALDMHCIFYGSGTRVNREAFQFPTGGGILRFFRKIITLIRYTLYYKEEAAHLNEQIRQLHETLPRQA